MKQYKEYKKTGLSWLPQIPSNWEWRFLSQVAHEQAIKKPSGVMFPVLTLSYGEVKRKKNIDSGLVPANYDTYQMLYRDNIILRLIDLQNDHTSLRTGLVQETGIITSAYTCIASTENAAYLHYLLHSYDTRKVFYGYGGGVRQSIGFKDIRYLQVPVPSRVEQDQIVRFLDWKASSINKLINIKHKEIAELEASKLLCITDKVTNGFASEKELKTCASKWIKNVPSHWKTISVRRAYAVILGKMLAPNMTAESDTLEEYVCAKDVHFDGINLADLKKMWFSPLEREQYRICDGDLLVVEGGAGAGNAAIVHKAPDKDIYVQNSIHIIRAKNGMANNKYLCFWLYSLVKRGYMKSVCSVATIPHYTKDKVLSTIMPLPPLNEQEEIVEYLEKRCFQIDAAIAAVESSIKELKELRARLIADAVTGKIDVRGIEIPEYEFVDEVVDADTEDDSEGETEEQEE